MTSRAPDDRPAKSHEDRAAAIAASIHLGIIAEENWDGPSIKPDTLTDEQITWLGSWLAGEGWDR